MKIGILTLPLWHNYGGILQAYALQRAVSELGHDAVFFDVRRPAAGGISVRSGRVKRALRRFIRGGRSSPWYADEQELVEISRNTRAFVRDHIEPKTSHIPIGAVKDIAQQFDAIIVGSDQVWRREYMPDLPTYFLTFPGAAFHRISYAASLGVDDWRFNKVETDVLARGMKQFRAVSVREDSAAKLLKRELGIDATRVCDPTLLFDSTDYCQLGGLTPKLASGAGRIFTYVLDAHGDDTEELDKLVQDIGREALNVMPKPFGPRFRSDPASHVFPSVEVWLNAFNECDFVITDSFHGCVFALLFNRPFVAVVNVERGRARFESLLGRYGLTDRLFASIRDINTKALAPIEWGRVNSVRADERRRGLSFLQAALTPEHRS
jgi:hypothetical protein